MRSFRVINQRRPLVVYFFANATQGNGFFSATTLAAQTSPLPFSNYNEPTQVHLALTQETGCALPGQPSTAQRSAAQQRLT